MATQAFEDFAKCMSRLAAADAALKAAYDSCEYDRGYFCHREQEEVEQCTRDAQAAFDDAVRESIARGAA